MLSINLLRRVVAAPSCFNWILCRSNKFGKAYFEESHTKHTLRFNILLNLVKMFRLYKELLKNSQRGGEFSPVPKLLLKIFDKFPKIRGLWSCTCMSLSIDRIGKQISIVFVCLIIGGKMWKYLLKRLSNSQKSNFLSAGLKRPLRDSNLSEE